jgi:O-succinylbenzoic acid--CoA ligase
VENGTRWLAVLPFYHAGGLSLLFRCFLFGGTVVLPEPDDKLGIQALSRQVDYVSLVPTQFRRLLDIAPCRQFPRPKAVLLGGAVTPRSLVREGTEAGFRLALTYGSTEMASQICTSPPSLAPDQLKTSGQVLPGRELTIDPAGEIFVRGDTLFDGYVTEEGLDRPFSKSGWFATGDLGYLDTAGNLVLTGRRDTMFISGGENLYPEEIEQQMLRLDGIEQALVVPVPDEQYGKRPVAFVQASPKAGSAREWTAALRRTLPGFKIPDHFLSWPTSEGERLKPDRADFARLARKQLNAE